MCGGPFQTGRSRKRDRFCPFAVIVALMFLSSALPGAPGSAAAGEFQFRIHEIARPGGNSFGQTSLVDLDRDGDLDFISGQSRGGSLFWFEQRSPEDWVTHRLGEGAKTDVGGIAFDVDGDGWIDQVSGGVWYRNPGHPREAPFERYETGAIPTHDNLIGDVDGDGRGDLISLEDDRGVFWYRIPEDPTDSWIELK